MEIYGEFVLPPLFPFLADITRDSIARCFSTMRTEAMTRLEFSRIIQAAIKTRFKILRRRNESSGTNSNSDGEIV